MNRIIEISKGILLAAFNPMGIPGALIPAYGDLFAEDREKTIYHEAGHTIVNHFLEHSPKAVKVCVRPNLYFLPQDRLLVDTKNFHGENANKAYIVVCMGGLAGVKMLRGKDYEVTGHEDDIKFAIMAIREIHGADLKRDEIKKILKAAEQRAFEILEKHVDKFYALAAALSEKRTLYAQDIENILGAREQSVLERSI